MTKDSRQQTAVSSKEYAVSSLPTTYCLLPTIYCQRGFTLLEIIIVLAIMGLMAGTFTPLALHLIGSKKAFANRDELQILKKAIIGDPLATQYGSEATFGYIGDMGNIPTNLQDLYTQPTGVSSFSLGATLTIGTDTITPRIGSGWRGPYVAKKHSSSTDLPRDPYKNTYTSTANQVNQTGTAAILATIRSPGPDRVEGTQDDLTVEIYSDEVFANVAGMIKNSEGAGIPTVSVSIIYPNADTLTSSTATTDIEGRYSFSSIPMGERAITLSPVLVYVPGTAYAGIDASTGLQEVEFRVANLSSSSVTITSIKATYSFVPTTNYTQVKIDGNLKQTGTFNSGTTVGFTSETVAASTMQREPFRLLLQSSRIEIPDIELTTIGAGGTKTIELQGFTAVTAGTKQQMVGVFFTVEFYNGSTLISKIIFTTQKR